jgi:hypothetical protein
MKTLLIVLAVVATMLAFTNPNEVDFRAHIQERQGIIGTLGLGLADLLSKDAKRGIHRDNFILFSKFYMGGDGILPRSELGWGIAGKCFDSEIKQERR